MFRIVICDEKKENIAVLSETIRKGIRYIKEGKNTEVFFAKPEALYNYSIEGGDTYIFFLDILYTGVSGIEVARRLRRQGKDIYIVFTTGHQELLSLALNQNIMPSGCINKQADDNEVQRILYNIYDYCSDAEEDREKILTIGTGSAVYRIDHKEILYIEAQNKKIFIHTATKRISCYHSLQVLGEELGSEFIRCHKGYLVSKSKIKNVYTKEMYVELVNGSRIPVSRTYKQDVLREVK